MVRQELPLDLKSGENQVNVNDITMHLEPDSVILRDPSGKHTVTGAGAELPRRSGFAVLLLSFMKAGPLISNCRDRSHDERESDSQRLHSARSISITDTARIIGAEQEEPIIEVAGQLRFGMPGTPVFPDLTARDDPEAPSRVADRHRKPGKFPAEFSYVTGGMSWQADYNIVAPEKGDLVDIVGWVTIDNRTGKSIRELAHQAHGRRCKQDSAGIAAGNSFEDG